MPIRNVILAISALAFSSIAASAADMAMRTKAPPIVVDPSYNWSGFYIGGNVGYGWGDADTSFNPLPSAAAFVNLAPTTLGPDPQGVIGGVQAGYNWQAGKFVVGLEADIQASDIHGSAVVTPIIQNNGVPFPGAGFLSASQRIDWFGTVRARAGFTPVDRLLLYVTGGLAYGNVSYAAQTDFRPVGTACLSSRIQPHQSWLDRRRRRRVGFRIELDCEGRVSLYGPRQRIDDCQSDYRAAAIPGRLFLENDRANRARWLELQVRLGWTGRGEILILTQAWILKSPGHGPGLFFFGDEIKTNVGVSRIPNCSRAGISPSATEQPRAQRRLPPSRSPNNKKSKAWRGDHSRSSRPKETTE